MAGSEALEGYGTPGVRVDAVELGGLDQGGDDSPMVAFVISRG